MSVSVSNIRKSYGKVKALSGISLEVRPGELFGLIGPDGAGKTTLFRILTTLLIADEGTARVAGYDVVGDFREIRKHIGYMPGKFSLYQDLTVEENLKFFATIFGTTLEENYPQIRDIYEHIEPFKSRRAGRLSGGMKQKLALSCALIHKPDVLFLDEPTTGVDPVSRRELWEMLKRLQKKGITILVSTAYMDEAGLCDRIALMQDGHILKTDRPREIIDTFPKRIYKIRARETYRLLQDLKHYPDTHSVYPFGEYLHFISTNPEFDPADMTRYLEEMRHSDAEVSETAPTIEDAFMELSKQKIENA